MQWQHCCKILYNHCTSLHNAIFAEMFKDILWRVIKWFIQQIFINKTIKFVLVPYRVGHITFASNL